MAGIVRAERDSPLALAHALHRDPPILIGPHTHMRLGPASATAPLLGDRPAWTFVVSYWALAGTRTGRGLVEAWHAHAAAHPRHRVTVLCNDETDRAALAAQGVAAVVCNHNIFVDDRVFAPDPAAPRDFDAVYNAALEPYKRHALCRDIDRLALLYTQLERCEAAYVDAVRAMLPRAAFINEAGGGAMSHRRRWAAALVNPVLAARPYVQLAPAAIAATYARAEVGLCLSAKEGAMFASMEYLMSGLPVVTTPSRGGRDHFFDPDYVLTVAPEPDAVRRGVAALAARALPREAVRAAVMERVRRAREAFGALLQETFRAAGVEAALPGALAGLFAGRPWRWHHPAALVGAG